MRKGRASRAEELPEGFRYRAEFVTEVEERELLDEIARLEFQAFEFHGYTAKRRVV
jgi:hypothetical protein